MPSRVFDPTIWRRPAGLVAVAVAGLLLGTLSAATAGVRPTWLLPNVIGYDLIPNPPNDIAPTTFVIYGRVFYPCPRVSNARVLDSGHIELTVSPGTCDSVDVGGDWQQDFALGLLPAGNHDLSIHLTIERPDSATLVEDGTFTFGVVDTSYHEPPPDTTRATGPLIEWIATVPSPARNDVPTQLEVHGYFPFDCGQVTNPHVVDDTLAEATLLKGAPCGDTTRVYDQSFSLGQLSAGTHAVQVRLAVQGDSNYVVYQNYGFAVIDPNAPPPPPGDSLKSVMSDSRPNPFRDMSNFSVSLGGPVHAEVAVFDLAGRRVRTVFSGTLPTGTTQMQWDGRRADGSPVPGGIYFYRLVMPDRVITRRVVLLTHP
jgi:hypothetical protein